MLESTSRRTSATTSDEQDRRHSTRAKVRFAIAAILVVAFAAVIVDNRGDTRVGYVVGDVEAPLVVVLLVTAVVGAAIGWLLLHRPRHQP